MKNRNMGCAAGLSLLPLLTMEVSADSEAPKLSITPTQNALLLAWPEWATNWVLEQAPHLRPPVPWTRLAGIPATPTNTLRINSAASGTNGFFRLRRLPRFIPGLSGHWRFDEGTGQPDADENPDAPGVFFSNASWSAGRVGAQALQFNGGPGNSSGTKAWVSNTNHRVLPAGQPFSVSLWFSPSALTTGWRGLAGSGVGGNGWQVALHTPAPGTNYLIFASPSLNVTGRTLLLPGQWYDLTATYDGAYGNLYLNGTLLARAAGTLVTDDGPIYFGGGIGNYDSFLGRIDEVRTYTLALTSEQVSLTGHWPFDDNTGSLAHDRSVNGHHARISGPAWVPGKLGCAILLNTNHAAISNEHLTVLPPTGGPFSLSFWLHPNSLPAGRSALMSCTEGAECDWQLALDVESSGQTFICFDSLLTGGTLNLRAPVTLSNATWSKLDLSYNGGIATLYVNGRKIHEESGAIQGSRIGFHLLAGRLSLEMAAGPIRPGQRGWPVLWMRSGELMITMTASIMLRAPTRPPATNTGSGPPPARDASTSAPVLKAPMLPPLNWSTSGIHGTKVLSLVCGTHGIILMASSFITWR